MQSGRCTFWGRFCLLSWSNARKGHFFPTYLCKMDKGFIWNGKTCVTQNWCVVSVLFFQVENVTRAPSPPSPLHSSMVLVLHFSYWPSCVVIITLLARFPTSSDPQHLHAVPGTEQLCSRDAGKIPNPSNTIYCLGQQQLNFRRWRNTVNARASQHGIVFCAHTSITIYLPARSRCCCRILHGNMELSSQKREFSVEFSDKTPDDIPCTT